jgi:hypothetical protein
MEEPAFRTLVESFRPVDEPVYVLLPRVEYDRLRTTWKLP